MDIILPPREVAERKGWNYQVQWMEDGHICFIRCTSGRLADAYADKLRKDGQMPTVINLRDHLQLN